MASAILASILLVLSLVDSSRPNRNGANFCLYGDSHCSCGHVTRTEPGRCEKEQGWEVELTEWHLVGPTLVSLELFPFKKWGKLRAKI